MIKPLLCALLFVFVSLTTSGCEDRLDMEDAVFPLGIGIDLDKDNNLLLYDMHPIFSKNVKKKSQEVEVKTSTLREARAKVDAYAPGSFQARKVQILLISKKILQQDGWFPMLDVYFRDPKNPLTPRIISYNGPLSDLVFLKLEDEPILPLLLRGMVDTKSARSETVSTTVQELHWQMYERGITPCISEVKMGSNKEIKLHGTTLLNHKGKYAFSISSEDSVLLAILQKNSKTVSMTLVIPSESKQAPFDTNRVSFNASKVKTKIKPSYQQDKFHFDIQIEMPVVLTELLFPFDLRANETQLEEMMAKQAQKRFEALVKQIQKHKIDPLGLGRYARAYQYDHFKKVKDHWGEELAKAEIHVSVKVNIQASGPVK
ncbi:MULTISPECIES: Ger(x)C family spore germination protein [unclassified Paenibacillus]|uniref:Ger(x)C family spore germination protein n=1 Tax=unclassified Paenibacillus TaxID=185978 RepID=UPI003629EC24